MVLIRIIRKKLNLLRQKRAKIINSLINFRIMMGLLLALPIIFMTIIFYTETNKGKLVVLMSITRQLFFYVPIMSVISRLYGIQWVYYGPLIYLL